MFKLSPIVSFLKKSALSVAIIIALNVFLGAGLRTFFTVPDYNAFCEDSHPRGIDVAQEDPTSCEEHGGVWEEYGYCNYTKECSEAFEQATKEYRLAGFIVLSVAGLISLFLGLLASLPLAVASGFSWGGVLSMLIGTAGYWSNMQNWLQLLVSGIILILLVGVGVWKLRD